MSIDTLIGGLARRFYQQVMTLPETAGGIQLPVPETAGSYLLYLHVPYCVVLCPFCSFHRVPFKRPDALSYFDCLQAEIRLATDTGYCFDELYIGGGTPTVLPDELFNTIELVRGLHKVDAISVETNPDDLGKEGVRRLLGAGVNRLSVGVQSFDDTLLREMQRFERYGSGMEIRRRLEQMTPAFETLNVDMIFNFPHQTAASLDRDLDILIDVGVDQVSFYPLMAADSTGDRMRREMGSIDYSREREFYELIQQRLLTAGYTRNSAWCFSRSPGMGDEYIVDREEYLGLGSGAFSYLRGSLFASTFSIGQYKELVRAGKTGTVRELPLSGRNQMRYFLLMKLFGGSIDLHAAEARFGGEFHSTIWPEIKLLRALGALIETETKLSLSGHGQYIWVVLMREFFAGINNLRDELRQISQGSRAAKPG
ncbi:MAG: coproporphyrinogen III oxidase family protein [Gammaproteobacteria bacterium]|nr:coproporphyrinogen III oxidase family protein [Gammaproteobacteria bacterium]